MKTKNILLAVLEWMLLAGCTSETVLDNKTEVMKNENGLIIVVDSESDNPTTRAGYSGFPTTSFETGDAIGLYAFDGSSYVANNVRFVRQSDGTWVSDDDVTYNEGHTYYAYFPYRSTTYSPSTGGTVTDIDTKFSSFINDASNYFWQADQSTKEGFTYSNLMIAKGVVTDVDDGIATVCFTMKHKRGLAVFNGEDAVDVSFSGNIPYIIGDTQQFHMKPSVLTSFSYNSKTYTMSAYSGEYVTHSIVMPKTDLSMVDNTGNERASMTTANCYLVHSAGRYKLPLVYGNAIKDGAVNTVSFYPDKDGAVDSNSPRKTLGRFVNHLNNGITGPWITKNGSGVDAGMGLTAASAELLWQDREGLVTKVSVWGDYLLFTVGSFGDGNALIAVKNSYGVVLWSWHIWATTETLENTTIVATGSHDYAVAPVNLGWVPTGGSGKQGYCPYYQWGRKDPFIPAHAVYNIAGADITPATITINSSGIRYVSNTSYTTISYSIQEPITFYYNSTTNGPVNTTYYNMWDAQNSSTENVATPTKKTIYDPCPPGFCVPTGNLYYYISNGRLRTMTTWDDTNKGAVWNENITGTELWLPAVGARIRSSASVDDVNKGGSYWPSTPYSTSSVRLLGLTFEYWASNISTKAQGYSVRPVVEE